MDRRVVVGLLVVLSGMWSCRTPGYNRLYLAQPVALRIAVLPFESPDTSEPFFARWIDRVPVIGEPNPERPEEILRRELMAKLGESGFEVVEPRHVDTVLRHFDRAGHESVAMPEFASLLGVDAVLSGRVSRWNRRYYAIESVVEVGLEICLQDVRTGDLLWEAEEIETERRGISKLPTGYVSLGLEPLLGLQPRIFGELARDLARNLTAPVHGARTAVRPPYVALSGHAFTSTPEGTHLLVFLTGTPGGRASFSIGARLGKFPMAEVEPGRYSGELPLSAEDELRGARITVELRAAGRASVSYALGRPAAGP